MLAWGRGIWYVCRCSLIGYLVADDEESSVGEASSLDQNSIVAGDLVWDIGDQWNAEVATETAIVAWGVGPGEVRELGVHRDCQQLSVDLLELLSWALNSSLRAKKAREEC